MSMMENIVRPFSPVDIFPALQAPRDTPVTPGVINLELGGSGGTTISMSFDGENKAVNNDNKFKESARQSTKVHVANPDDPDQFVEFCRADKITLSPLNTDRKKAVTSSYDPSGGVHQFSQSNVSPQDNREYSFQYPDENAPSRACVTPAQPDRGC